MRKRKLTGKQLDALFDCWVSTLGRKDFIAAVAQKIPELSPPTAFAAVRKLSKSDQKWIEATKRKENAKEQAKLIISQKKEEKQKKRQEKERAQEKTQRQEGLRQSLTSKHVTDVAKEIPADVFFCPKVYQFTNVIACIFRTYSEETQYGLIPNPACLACTLHEKYMPVLEHIVRRPNESKEGNTPCDSSKDKKERRKAARNTTTATGG
jgi:hypothetical protein